MNKSSATPQCNQAKAKMKEIFSREGIYKTFSHNNNNKSRPQSSSENSQNMQTKKNHPVDSLYHRVRQEVVNNKLLFSYGIKGSGVSSTKPYIAKNLGAANQSHSNISSSAAGLKRDETPKDVRKPVTTNPSEQTQPQPQHVERPSTSTSVNVKSKLSKKGSFKAINTGSPLKKTKDRSFYTSYDLSQVQLLKKPVAKLDLTKRATSQK